MRSARSALFVGILLFTIPSWSKQPPQNASPIQPASDPQAVAVVQAAITALGGATAISQAQNWTFQAQLQGPHANGNVSYSMSTNTDVVQLVLANGTTKPVPLIQSHFLPALVGAILLKESQDPAFAILTGGSSTLDSAPVKIIVFAIGAQSIPAQIWYFNSADQPVLVDFMLPAEIGARRTFSHVVALSDYRSVSGVLYPHEIVWFVPGKPREIVTLLSVIQGASALSDDFSGQAGDAR